MRFTLMAAIAAALTCTCVSCDKDEIEQDIPPVELQLNSLKLDVSIDKGSLPEEYVQELLRVEIRRYADQSLFPDVQSLAEKCIAEPMQEKINDIAAKTGCYDFSVTITAYDIQDPTKAVYTKTLRPQHT